jgi:central kinetochore subunit Mal2/MCM21
LKIIDNMALAASPPMTEEQEAHSLQLDEDIERVRAEINALSQRRTRLASALLSSDQVRSRMQQHPSLSHDSELTAVLDRYTYHNSQSIHRLVFGVTAFPFVDPSPDTSNVPLIGIKFDICKRNGQFDSPYYVLCKRVHDEGSEVRVHRHTIPALIPIAKYEEKYLPLPDEGYGSADSVLETTGRQDLEAFVTAVKGDLVAWHLRQQSIDLVREKLGITARQSHAEDGDKEQNSDTASTAGLYGVRFVEPVAVDSHYARIVWTDDTVGRVKIGHDGSIQRAVVIGTIDGQEQRRAKEERILVADNSRIDTLVDRLKDVHAAGSSK